MSGNRYQLSDIFQCVRCGFCCHGETTVSLDEKDQARMIRVLGLSPEETRRRYWRITGSVVQMKIQDGHCIFYDGEAGCTVHAGRPWRCRQWPLHPSMLHDAANYQAITASCPGFNKDIGYDLFCRILQACLESTEGGDQGI
ncbi:YkgJ family cysteine cluster protein [Desulfobulbus alkaliphilus]|uniref:YkgJ family cysteine cluster protein n=1 Tax=Desulfobulbus alkaliphilus TaxID=869814 RepID=UPI001965A7AA|nr:YkgJ family cysteine cluster protein [Desulfobulbus alkaliphilus]MBM9537141.1 YkgJ family cysteine cluster protein [Desulfobulbus alkaliphilus]